MTTNSNRKRSKKKLSHKNDLLFASTQVNKIHSMIVNVSVYTIAFARKKEKLTEIEFIISIRSIIAIHDCYAGLWNRFFLRRLNIAEIRILLDFLCLLLMHPQMRRSNSYSAYANGLHLNG